jgi:6-phospho-beta-glucosidase
MIRTFTVVGGGSAYVPGLIAALLHHGRSLSLTRVRLYDIHHENLEIVAKLVQRMAEAAGSPLELTAHTELTAALEGTDVVLNTSRPGGLECRRIDETLPLELGIPGQETVGPGGFFFALRSVPAALELVQAIERTSPHAILLNYTNPTNVVTQALCERTRVTVIGLCDQSDEDIHDLCRALGVAPEFELATVGLNHAVWYRDLVIGGAPLPKERIARLEPPSDLTGEYRLRFTLAKELALRHPGTWPSSYLPYYRWPERFVAMAKEAGPRSDAIMKRLPSYFAHFREEAAKEKPNLVHHRGAAGFGDLAVRVLRALGRSIGTPIVLNVPNFAAAPEFQATTVVETTAYVSNAGIIRRATPRLPEDQKPLLLALERYQRAAAAAAASQDPNAATDALAENPLVGSKEVAAGLMEKAKVLYRSTIPMFA